MAVDTVCLNEWFAVGFRTLDLILCQSMVTKSHRVLWHFEIYEGFRNACLKCQSLAWSTAHIRCYTSCIFLLVMKIMCPATWHYSFDIKCACGMLCRCSEYEMREKHWEQKLIVHEQRERDHELQVRIVNSAPISSVISPQVEARTLLILGCSCILLLIRGWYSADMVFAILSLSWDLH